MCYKTTKTAAFNDRSTATTKQLAQSKKQVESDPLLTREQVCQKLHISTSTLHRFVKCGVLIAYKIGRRTLFKCSQIEAALIQSNN
ncbi:MAG: helix-turn-helix domain-containing protein [Mucinivorans sp.]